MPYHFHPRTSTHQDPKAMKPAHNSSRAAFLRSLRSRRNPSVVITLIALAVSIVAVAVIAGVVSVLVVPR